MGTQYAASSRRQAVGSKHLEADSREQLVGRQQKAVSRLCAVGSRQQVAGCRKQAAAMSSRQQAACSR